jgi:hypothetical protein
MKNIILITAHNNIADELPYGIKTWEHYCNRHDIELIIVNEKIESDFDNWAECSYKKWNIQQIIDREFDRILVVDIDTMIRWDAPNIFDQFPDVVAGTVPHNNNFSDDSLGRYHVSQWLPLNPDIRGNLAHYSNAGLLLLSRENYMKISELIHQYYDFYVKAYYDDNIKLPDAAEQTPVNIILWNDIGNYTLLPIFWNNLVMAKYDDASFINDSFVWHFTGPKMGGWGNKGNIMKQVYDATSEYYSSP